MISIIICNRTEKLDLGLLENIRSTIGCSYEIITIDNSKNKYSIFQAYNIGIKKSKGAFWCFMHDDILLHTKNWGLKIKEIFKSDNKIGLLGVAGAKVKTKMPSAWWDCNDKQKVIHLRQHLNNGKVVLWDFGWNNRHLEEVVVIDGLFMVAKRNEDIFFNELLKGFHNYDLNLSILYKKLKFKVVVTNSILIEHFSFGTINKSWCSATLKFDTQYKKILPLQVKNSLSRRQFKQLEFKNGRLFCEKLIKFNFKRDAFFYWLRLVLLKPKSKFHFKFLKAMFD